MRAAEHAILVGAPAPATPFPTNESMAELRQLAETAGLCVVGEVLQVRRQTRAATLIGAGKIESLRHERLQSSADVVIFDDPLSPAQQRNLEAALGCKVIDRSALILDIFAQHARSVEGKLQVELAQLQYLLPRLTRQWTHLSRLGGGGVGTRGPGETQLEVDRRRVRERLGQLRRRLAEVERTRSLHQRERKATPCPTAALVGYTNAGKSTLMNRLTGAHVPVQDQLFATLDPTVRRLRLPGGAPALLADTVGFIHKLPHQLVEAFKSTLEQVRLADVLVHVVDVSHPAWREHVVVVERVLADIGAGKHPTVYVFNKCDRPLVDRPTPREIAARGELVSAREGIGLDSLLDRLSREIDATMSRIQCRLSAGDGDLLALIHRSGRVLSQRHLDDEVFVTALVPPKVAGQLHKRAHLRAETESC